MLSPSDFEHEGFYESPELGVALVDGCTLYGHFDVDGRLVRQSFRFLEALREDVAETTRTSFGSRQGKVTISIYPQKLRQENATFQRRG